VRAAEGLVRVEVHHVGAEIAGAADAQDGVHVGAVKINESAAGVDSLRDQPHAAFEQPQRAGVRDHEYGDLIVKLRAQVVEIDEALSGALHGDRFEPGHAGARGVRAVSAIGGQNSGALLALVAKVSRGRQQRGELSVSPSRRLERDCRQAGDLSQDFLHFKEQREQPLERSFRLIWMEFRHRRRLHQQQQADASACI